MTAAYIDTVCFILQFITEILVDAHILAVKSSQRDLRSPVLWVFCREVSAGLINGHEDHDDIRILTLDRFHDIRDISFVLCKGTIVVQVDHHMGRRTQVISVGIFYFGTGSFSRNQAGHAVIRQCPVLIQTSLQ